MPDRIEPFTIGTEAEALDDLRARLRHSRWPERETVGDWSQGVPLAYLQDLCGYWAGRYDWRATEARLNAFPQLLFEVNGQRIHVVHARSAKRCGQGARVRKAVKEPLEQQVHHRLVRDPPGQLIQRTAADHQAPGLAVDLRQHRVGRDHAFQTFRHLQPSIAYTSPFCCACDIVNLDQ